MTNTAWPEDKNLISPNHRDNLLRRLRPHMENLMSNEELPTAFWSAIESVHLPLAAWLAGSIDQDGCRILGIAGGQGSGKSTLAKLLVAILHHGFGKKAVTFSIDDIYLSRAERQQLATNVHPLLTTRGVPGTHDPLLGLYLLQQLRAAGPGDLVHLPVFDKAIDDRLPPDQWRIEEGPFDLVIFEGWCVGAMPQTEDELIEPVNALERDEDSDGLWRQFVNDELSGPYIELFAAIDILLMLKVPGMEQVLAWRVNQEEKLRRSRAADRSARGIMNGDEIARFIQHYERISRNMIKEMPDRTDILLELDAGQNISRIICR